GGARVPRGARALADPAPPRRDAELLRRDEENLRVRLAALCVLGRGDRVEEVSAPGDLQDQLDVGAGGAGADRLPEPGSVQSFEQRTDAGQQFHAPAGGGAVEFLLAEAEVVQFLFVESVSEEVLEDFGGAPA